MTELLRCLASQGAVAVEAGLAPKSAQLFCGRTPPVQPAASLPGGDGLHPNDHGWALGRAKSHRDPGPGMRSAADKGRTMRESWRDAANRAD